MIRLSKRQILTLHAEIIREFGGDDGIRDEALLEAAIAAPFQSYEEVDLFPSVRQKAARLGFGLVRNHPFMDGNKRIGAHAMLVFLELNRLHLAYTQASLAKIFLAIADGEANYTELLRWIEQHEVSGGEPRSS